ncbi:MAG: hypothetical protein JNN07_04205 [Verrucomicrobiales bacterium]|nr:hypothetical protein [Verrucomicrobiales bacterium]
MNKPCVRTNRLPVRGWPFGFVALLWIGLSFASGVPPDANWLSLAKIDSEPVAMSWDTRPRLWLLEAVTTSPGRQGRVLIVEESAAPQPSHALKLFSDELPDSTGFIWTPQGVLVGTATGLWLLQDTNLDDRVDRRQQLVTGFLGTGQGGKLTSFVRGPDSWIYFLHEGSGVASLESKQAGVVVPSRAGCGVMRYHPEARILETVSDGPLLPVALAFDPEGNLFAATRTRESLFHIVAGGNFLPLNSFPTPLQYRTPRMGAVGDPSLHRYGSYGLTFAEASDAVGSGVVGGVLWFTNVPSRLSFRLQPDGAGFRASAVFSTLGPEAASWLERGERSIAGPGGAMWVRSGVGIARIGGAGLASAASWSSLARVRSAELIPLLESTNGWLRTWARQRLASEASAEDRQALFRRLDEGPSTRVRLESLWTLASLKAGRAEALTRALAASDAVVRAWGVRLLGEVGSLSPEQGVALRAQAEHRDPRVRREVANSLRRLAYGAAAATNEPTGSAAQTVLQQAMESLLLTSAGEADDVIKSLAAGAFDSLVARDEVGAFQVLRRVGDPGLSLAGELLNRAVQQLFASRDARAVNRGLDFLFEISEESPALCAAGLMGMMKGQKSSKVWTGYPGVKRLLKRLAASPNDELAGAARQVDAFCGNPAAQNAIIAKVNDSRLPEAERLKAIRFTEVIPSELARSALLEAVMATNLVSLQGAAMEVLRVIGKTEDLERLVRRWDGLSTELRQVSSEVLVAKLEWVPVLLRGLEEGRVRAADLSPQAVVRLREHPNLKIRARALAALDSSDR